MNRLYSILLLISITLFFSACSIQSLPIADPVYMLGNEEELKEQIQINFKNTYGLTHYYRPASIAENLTLKHIVLTQYNVKFTYIANAKDDSEYNFVWFFSQADGDACLESDIDRLGYAYVYPDNPMEGTKYVSDMNRNEAKKAGRVTWHVNYSANGVLFGADIPWDIRDEDVTKYLLMEKVEIK